MYLRILCHHILQLQPEWFYRVSSLALDLLTLGSLAGLEWKEPLKALVGRDGHASGRGADLVGSFEGKLFIESKERDGL